MTDDDQRIGKGTPVYGEVTAIDGERVIVKISSININNNILPFKKTCIREMPLKVYMFLEIQNLM